MANGKTRKTRKRKSNISFEINNPTRLGLFIVSIFLILCFLSSNMGRLGLLVNDAFYFLLGNGHIILPILLIFIGINSYLNSIETSDLFLVGSAILFLLVSVSFFDSISTSPGIIENRFSFSNNPRSLGINGGILGALINYALIPIIGELGLYLLLVILFLISVFVFFNLDYEEIGKNISKGFEFLGLKISGLFNFTKNKAKNLKERQIKMSNRNIEQEKMNLEPSPRIRINGNKLIDSFDAFEDAGKVPLRINDSSNQSSDEEFKSYYIEKDEINKKELEEKEKISKVTSVDKISIQKEVEENQPKPKYEFPPISLLNKRRERNKIDKDEIYENSKIIEETMANFGIDARVSQVNSGPTVTCYELVPAQNVKLSRIVSLADNLSFSLASSDIRIEAPIPGKTAVGIEVPNKEKSMVSLEEVINSKTFKENKSDLPLVLGKDTEGDIIISAIDEMPHLLVAGATGSGKSVCINSIIISLLYKTSPDDLRMILIDPKIVELGVYNAIPHLLIPVVTNPKKAASTLAWAVEEMERRYKTFAENYVKDITNYNKKMAGTGEKMTKIVIIIDELADLMMVASNEVEDYIARLAQMARAAGMHLILATQRPSVDVITGTIKANIPSRISFAVSSQVDSRTILDSSGAEKLLGKGDMLFYPSFYSKPTRIQGCFVSQGEVDRVIEFFNSKNYQVDVSDEIIEEINNVDSNKKLDADPLMMEALKLVVYDEQASISYLQRKLAIGYSRAARIVDQLEELGYVGPSRGSKPRDINISEEEYLQLLGEDFD